MLSFSPEDQHKRMEACLASFVVDNPGSRAFFQHYEDGSFRRLFFCAAASIHHIENLPPVFTVDGAFPKTSYGGQIHSLAALSRENWNSWHSQ